MVESKIFSEEKNATVVHEVTRWLLASARQGTHSAKTRAEVSGGGKKPWKQKGTGRARAGSNRSPLWRKGGVIFPPKPRDYSYNLPKKVRKLAIRVMLSDMKREDRVKIMDSFALSAAKTKEGAKFLKEAGVSGKVLIVMGEKKVDFEKGMRNLRGVNLVLSKNLNVIDLLKSDWLLIDKDSVAQLEERLS